MAIPTLADESRAQHGFYVPQFEIRIEGVGLPHDVLRDVSQVTYNDNLKEIDGFEITVNNWDATHARFKYVGSESQADLKGSTADSARYRLFDPCNKEVEVRIGYLGELRTLMVSGTFTTLEPTFPGERRADAHRARPQRAAQAAPQAVQRQRGTTRSDSEIAKDIGELTVDKDLGKNQKRFPMPIVVTDEALAQGDTRFRYVAQTNQYDIDFLLAAREAARLRRVHPRRRPQGEAEGPAEDAPVLRAVGRADARRARRRCTSLRWGASLIDFKPTLTTANQVKSVTVNGWDRDEEEGDLGQGRPRRQGARRQPGPARAAQRVRPARGGRRRQAGAHRGGGARRSRSAS